MISVNLSYFFQYSSPAGQDFLIQIKLVNIFTIPQNTNTKRFPVKILPYGTAPYCSTDVLSYLNDCFNEV